MSSAKFRFAVCITSLVAGLCACYSAAAQEGQVDKTAPGTYFIDDPKLWAQPKLIVRPVYPPDLLARGITGQVDFDVRIGITGYAELLELKSTPDNPDLEKAVKSVLRGWIFYPTMGDDCVPRSVIASARVWFEIREGEASISVSRRAIEKPACGACLRVTELNREQLVADASHLYPRDARKRAEAGLVFLALNVDVDTGKVRESSMVHFVGDTGSRRAFSRAAQELFSRAQYSFEDAPKGGIIRVCRSVLFSLGG